MHLTHSLRPAQCWIFTMSYTAIKPRRQDLVARIGFCAHSDVVLLSLHHPSTFLRLLRAFLTMEVFRDLPEPGEVGGSPPVIRL